MSQGSKRGDESEPIAARDDTDHRLRLAWAFSRLGGPSRSAITRSGQEREAQDESGAKARLRLDLYGAVRVFEQVLDRGETKAGPLAGSLRGEEGLEDAGLDIWCHPGTGVTHFKVDL